MAKLYRLGVPAGNGVLASLTRKNGYQLSKQQELPGDPTRVAYLAAVRSPAPPPLSATVPAGFRLRPSKLKTCRFFSTMHWITTVLLFLLNAAP